LIVDGIYNPRPEPLAYPTTALARTIFSREKGVDCVSQNIYLWS